MAAPPSTVDGSADSRTYTLTKGTPAATGGYVSVSRSGTVIARIDISNWWDDGYAKGLEDGGSGGSYNDGWAAAYGKMSWPGTGYTTSFSIGYPSSTVGNSTSKTYYVVENAWSSGSKLIRVRDANFTYVSEKTVTIPDATNWNISYNASGCTVTFSVGGKSFSHFFSD